MEEAILQELLRGKKIEAVKDMSDILNEKLQLLIIMTDII